MSCSMERVAKSTNLFSRWSKIRFYSLQCQNAVFTLSRCDSYGQCAICSSFSNIGKAWRRGYRDVTSLIVCNFLMSDASVCQFCFLPLTAMNDPTQFSQRAIRDAECKKKLLDWGLHAWIAFIISPFWKLNRSLSSARTLSKTGKYAFTLYSSLVDILSRTQTLAQHLQT